MDIEHQSDSIRLTPLEAQLIDRILTSNDSEAEQALRDKVKQHLTDWALSAAPHSLVDNFSGSTMGRGFIMAYALHDWTESGQSEPPITLRLSSEELRLIRDEAHIELQWRQHTASKIDTFMATQEISKYADDPQGAEEYKSQAFETDLKDIALCGAIVATINRHLGDGNK